MENILNSTEYLFHYRAVIQSVYDGDTVTADIDLGLGLWKRKEKLRLNRINAPEVRGGEREQGLLARDFLRGLIDGKEVVVQTIKDKKGKYGRYIADIWIEQETASGIEMLNVSDLIVSKGHAEYREY